MNGKKLCERIKTLPDRHIDPCADRSDCRSRCRLLIGTLVGPWAIDRVTTKLITYPPGCIRNPQICFTLVRCKGVVQRRHHVLRYEVLLAIGPGADRKAIGNIADCCCQFPLIALVPHSGSRSRTEERVRSTISLLSHQYIDKNGCLGLCTKSRDC